MAIPKENGLAFFPPSRKVGNITLRPLTLAGVVALADAGIDLGKRIDKDHLFQAAYILGQGAGLPEAPSFVKFLKRSRVGLAALSTTIESVLNDAYETYIRPARSSSTPTSLTPKGLGWPLEMAECLCAEYGWSWKDAINTPLATAHALLAAARVRHGQPIGIDYTERHAKPITKL